MTNRDEGEVSEKELAGDPQPDPTTAADVPRAQQPATEVVREITWQVEQMAKTDIDLLKAELHANLSAETGAAKRLAVSVLTSFMALNLLLVTGVLSLAQVLPAWQAGLIASSTALAIAVVAGLLGWNKLPRTVSDRTR